MTAQRPYPERAPAKSWTWRSFFAAAAPGLLITALLLGVQLARPGALSALSNLLFDTYQRVAPRPYQEAPVRIVDIDDASIARLGQWPWPRTEVAELISRLHGAGAATVAMDIVFSEPDRTSPARVAEILRANPAARGDYADIAAMADHDKIMGEVVGRGPTVLGYFLTLEPNPVRPRPKAGVGLSGESPVAQLQAYRGAIIALPEIGEAAAGEGFVSIQGSGDGIIRSAPMLASVGGEIVPSLSLEALRVAQGAGALLIKSTSGSGELSAGPPEVAQLKVGDFTIPTTEAGQLWLHYREHRADIVTPAWRILTGNLSPDEMRQRFEGRIVLVGSGAAGLRDIVATPLRQRELGVMVHAQAIEQMILGDFLARPRWALGLERALLVLMGVALSLAMPFLSPLRGAAVAALLLGGMGAGSWLAFRQAGLLVDPTFPVLAGLGAYVACTALGFYREERARRYIRRAFDRYLSPELVGQIVRDPSRLELGGEERDMTVMFCDIRGFSRIAEALGPQEVIRFLITLQTPMSDVLMRQKGTIDKYIGDGIVAFWNAPLDDPDHARHAALAALEMQEKLREMNRAPPLPAPLWPGEVRLGIGLNTGVCCVGNMGSVQRLNYSLIGDPVNLASRIEGLTKIYGVDIAVGAETARRLEDFALIEIDLVKVVGRQAPEEVFVLMGPPETRNDSRFRELLTAQTRMLAAYHAQDWDAAEANLPAIAAGGLPVVADLYARRIEGFRLQPPPADWDGVYISLSK
jgi:adenylate cyclase